MNDTWSRILMPILFAAQLLCYLREVIAFRVRGDSPSDQLSPLENEVIITT